MKKKEQKAKPEMKMTRRKLQVLHKKHIQKWTASECIQADRFIQRAVIRNLKRNLQDVLPAKGVISEYVIMMVDFDYGSGETDDFLIAMNCYEDWMFSEEDNKRRKKNATNESSVE